MSIILFNFFSGSSARSGLVLAAAGREALVVRRIFPPERHPMTPPEQTSSKTAHPLAPERVLTALALALVGLQLLLASWVSFEDLRMAMLAAIALVALGWSARARRQMIPRLTSMIPGFAVIGYGLWRTGGSPGSLWVSIAPAVWGLGLALVVSGWRGLADYWREAIVITGLVASCFVETVVLELGGFDLAPTSARTTAFLLRLGGWNASARDVVVSLPDAWVVVSQGCSGLKTMFFLTAFAVVLLLVYPVPGWWRKAVVLGVAPVVGYFVNAARMVVLALLASPGNESAFKFWHIKQGAMIFEIAAVAVFLGIVSALLPSQRKASVIGKETR